MGHLDAAEPTDVLDSSEAGGKAIRGGMLRVASFFAGILFSLATVPLMIRHLGVVDFGRFAIVTSIVLIVAGVTEAGLTGIGIRELSLRKGDERHALMANLAGMRTTLTLLGVALAVGFAWISGYDGIVVVGVAISGTGLVVAVIQQTYGLPLAASLRWGAYSTLDLTTQAATAILVLVLVLMSAGLVPFYFISIGSSLAALIVTIAIVRGDIAVRPAANLAEWKHLIRDALPYTAAATIGVIYFRVAIILMSLLSTETETGYYSAAFKIVEAVGGLAWILTQSAFPILARAARDDQERLRSGLGRVLEVSMIAGVWMTLAAAIGARFAIDVVAGPGFGPAIPVLRIQALTLAAGFLVATWSYALLSLRMHRQLLLANAGALAVALAGTLALVPSHGATGAAIATAASEFTLAGGYAFFLYRGRPDMRTVPSLLPALTAATLAAIAVGALVPVPAIVAVILMSIVYFAILLVGRAIPPELWHATSSWRSGLRGTAGGG